MRNKYSIKKIRLQNETMPAGHQKDTGCKAQALYMVKPDGKDDPLHRAQ